MGSATDRVSRLEPGGPPAPLFPGCRRIVLPDPYPPGVTAAFLLQGEQGPWLVDAGADSDASGAELRRSLELVGTAPERLQGVILTHSHLDHAGGLLRFPPKRLVAHAAAAAEMANPRPRSSRGPEALRRMGLPEEEIAELAPGGEPVEPGRLAGLAVTDRLAGARGELPELPGWRWTLAEGHAPGLLLLEHPGARAALTSDQCLGKLKTPYLISDPDFDSFGAYEESLRGLRRRGPESLYPSHVPAIRPAASWLRERLLALEEQRERTLGAVRDGARTAAEALARASSRELQGGLKVLLLRETLAILRNLAAGGELRRRIESGREVYEP